MSTDKTGGPAFPVFHQNEITEYIPPETAGMTLRDYFAAKAMQAFITNPLLDVNAGEHGVAASAYKVADAMLEAREQ